MSDQIVLSNLTSLSMDIVRDNVSYVGCVYRTKDGNMNTFHAIIDDESTSVFEFLGGCEMLKHRILHGNIIIHELFDDDED